MLENSQTGQTASRPIPSGTARLRKRKARQDDIGPKSRWLILAIVLIFSIGLVLSGEGRDFIRYLYSPIAIIIVILAIIEYIVLKGRDRSRIYRMEFEQAREKRRQDLEFMREVEKELEGIAESLSDASNSSDQQAREQNLDHIQQAGHKISSLRKRISNRL